VHVLAERPAAVLLAGADRAVIATGRDTRWLDLTTGKATTVDDASAFVELAASPAGDAAVVTDVAHRGRVVGPGRAAVALGDAAIDRAGFVDATHVLAGGADGAVHLFDGGADAVLVRRNAAVVALAWSTTDVAAAFADKVVWRHSLAGHGDDTLTLAAPASALAFAGDGTLAIAAKDEIHAWRGGPHETTVAILPRPIADLVVSGDQLAALADDGEAFVAPLSATATRPAPTIAADRAAAARGVARSAGLVVATPSPGELAIVDPFAGAAWPLASAITGATFEQPRISDAGTRVLALVPGGVVAWRIELPADAAATAAWLAHMTNARAASATARLQWR
jgi:hypothetical protein